MNSDDLGYILIRGLDVPYMGIKVKQPTIGDVDRIGLLNYFGMSYIFRIQKEHLQLYDEIKDKLNGKSLFESLVIQEKVLMSKQDFNYMNSEIMRLVCSLAFFLGIEDFNKIKITDDYKIVVYDFNEVGGQVINKPVFELSEKNFDEFSELIRIITCNDIIELDKDKPKELYAIYDDPELQREYDEMMGDYKEKKNKEEDKNKISFNDIIHDICSSKYSKETIDTISKRTIWHIFDIYKSMNAQESVDFNKQQYCSYKFEFKENPIIDWKSINKIKVETNGKLLQN